MDIVYIVLANDTFFYVYSSLMPIQLLNSEHDQTFSSLDNRSRLKPYWDNQT